jgi:predicted nucleic acid-binding protein
VKYTFVTAIEAWLLAASGTSDIVDAHVVICARRTGQHVVTSDPGDLRLLDPAVRLIAI